MSLNKKSEHSPKNTISTILTKSGIVKQIESMLKEDSFGTSIIICSKKDLVMQQNIPFNQPYLTGKEAHYIYEAVYTHKHISGNCIYQTRQKSSVEKLLLV